MGEPPTEKTIRRILVALDASLHSLAALEAAAELAAYLEAELLGLFVEDVNLLHAASLPYVREVRQWAAATQDIHHEAMQQQLRAQARRVRRSLEAVTSRTGVPYSFRVTRGQVAAEVLTASAEADLVILGKAGLTYHTRRRLGSTARRVLVEAAASVLVLHRGLRLGPAVLVLYDGAPLAEAVLALAAVLARRRADGRLTVLVHGGDAAERAERQRHVTERYAGELGHLQVRVLTEGDAAHVGRVVYEERAGLLVVPAGSPVVQRYGLQPFLLDVHCPVLVVR